MNLINELTAAQAAFEGLMADALNVDPSTWSFEGLSVQGGDLVFCCSESVTCWEHIPFQLRVPASVVATGLTVDALEQVISNDWGFRFAVRRLHRYMVDARLAHQRDVEVEMVMDEAETQDLDSRNYVDYHVRLGVDPSLL